MYNTQSNPHSCGNRFKNHGGYRSARHAAKRAKFEAWMQAKAEKRNQFMNRFSAPPVNVKEEDDRYELHLFAAGFAKDAFDITLTDNILTIVGKGNEKENSDNWRRQEFTARGFERKFELNDKINTDKISADYNDGVLVVTMNKKEGEERIRQSISVK